MAKKKMKDVAKIDPKTGNPIFDDKGKLVTHKVDVAPAEPSPPPRSKKKAAATKAALKTAAKPSDSGGDG